MSRPPPKFSPEYRREIFNQAIDCLQCDGALEKRIARPFLYLITRRVRQAYRQQKFGATRADLRDRLSEIQKATSALQGLLKDGETRQALDSVGTVPHHLDPDLARVKEMACGAIAKLNLAGRQGSDRAAHSFEFHARPLLVMYLGRLLVTRAGRMPAENNTGFLELLSLTWEYATGESSAVGWQRHIRATDRDLVIPDGSGYSGISLSGSGPSTPLIFFSAYLQAGVLAREFQKALERRRYASRQKNWERRSSQD